MAPAPKINLADKVDDGEMDLSMCDLQEVPVKEIAAYHKVWCLDLSNNHLVQISKKFPTLTNLTKLDLSKNKLKKLPDNFGDLHRLKHLDLYKNELQHLPLSFGQLRNLKWLDLKDNPLVPAIQEAAGDCLDTAQCQVCATNMIYFFTKLREKVEEERDLRDRQRQSDKEKQHDLTVSKSRTNLQEKNKKKKEVKNNATVQGKAKMTEPVAEDTPVCEFKPKERKTVKKQRRSFISMFFIALFLLLGVLFVLTACGFSSTMFVEEFAVKTWSSGMFYCSPSVKDACDVFAQYFVFAHHKVGHFLSKPENKSYLSMLNGKVQEMYHALIQ